ncbi:hypothetical protein KAJ27_16525 [bacterium]|nr:hypothetical protein [bacterium]
MSRLYSILTEIFRKVMPMVEKVSTVENVQNKPYVVNINKSELEEMLRECRKIPGYETGGAFHGFIKNDHEVVVTYVSGPGEKAIHERHHFQMDLGLLRRQDYELETNYRVSFTGGWHLHQVLEGLSFDDVVATAKIARRNNFRILVQIIVLYEQKNNKDILTIIPFFFTDAQGCKYQQCILNVLPGKSPIRTALETSGFISASDINQADKESFDFVFPSTESLSKVEKDKFGISQVLLNQLALLPEAVLKGVEINAGKDLIFVEISKRGLDKLILVFLKSDQKRPIKVFYQDANENVLKPVNIEMSEIWQEVVKNEAF